MKYTIYLNPSGGTGGSTCVIGEKGEYLSPIDSPSLKNRVFIGYFDEDGKKYYNAKGDSIRPWDKEIDETELSAKWQGLPYIVRFNGNGSTEGNMVFQNGIYQEELTLNENKFSKKHTVTFLYNDNTGRSDVRELESDFLHWKGELEETYTDGASVSIDNPITETGGTYELKAQWENKTLSSLSLTREGYEPIGWFDKEEGGNLISEIGTEFLVDKDMYLFMHWQAKTYSITLNPNGGSGGTTGFNAIYDATMPPINVPTWEGHTFNGYFLGDIRYYNQNGIPDRKWNIAEATTLKAKWDANTYTIAFNKDGGMGGKNGVIATYGETLPSIVGSLPLKDGYTFQGYYSGETQYYTNQGEPDGGKTWDVASDAVLWAKWNANLYTITFDKNGGEGGRDTVMASYGETLPSIAGSIPYKKGYGFMGYYLNNSQYYDETGIGFLRWNVKEDSTLTAYWKPKVFDVILNMSGGIGGTSLVKATYDVILPSVIIPSKKGYQFNGYALDDVIYINNVGRGIKPWDKENDSELTAVWTAKTNKIIFDKQGGEGGTNDVIATYGSILPEIEIPFKVGYKFDGYWDSNDFIYYMEDVPIRKWDKEDDTVLFASWNPKTSLVKLMDADGVTLLGTVRATYRESLPSVEIPTKEGCDFQGYFSGTTRYYNKYGIGDIVWEMDVEEPTLTAKWLGKEFSIVYRGNGATSGGVPTQTGRYGEPVMIRNNGFINRHEVIFVHNDGTGNSDVKPNNLDFEGWAYDNGEVEEKYQPMDLVTFYSSGNTVILNASWIIEGQTIPTVTRVGYNPLGWYTAAVGGTCKYPITQTEYDGDDDGTVYMHWEANDYIVTFNKDGGTGGDSSQEVTFGDRLQRVYIPSKAGYVFQGYFLEDKKYFESDGRPVDGQVWDVPNDATLVAKWVGVTYTIRYDVDEITHTTSVRYGDEVLLETGSGILRNKAVVFDENHEDGHESTMEFSFAIDKWKDIHDNVYPITNKVKIETPEAQAGGTVILQPIWYTFDEKIAPEPVREGFTFDAWYDLPIGGQLIFLGGLPMADMDIFNNDTVHAHWNPIEMEQGQEPISPEDPTEQEQEEEEPISPEEPTEQEEEEEEPMIIDENIEEAMP